MKPLPTARLFRATAALFAASLSGLLVAQTRSEDPMVPSGVMAAALSLPDAPMPQGGDGVGTGVLSSPASSSSSSSLAQAQSAPVAPDGSTPAAPPVAPADVPACSVTPQPAQPDCAKPGAATPATPAAPAETKEQQQHDEAERELRVQEKQRLLGVMPQFQVVMGGNVVPLTAGEKWRLAAHSAIDPFYIGYAFVVSGGYGELVDSHAGFGWGPGGYFKRVGAGYADNVNGALIGNALLPAILHQDPRYFRKGTGSIGSRFVYAALSTVICRGDNGKNQPNVSNVLGNFISGAISNAYYPANERGFALTMENGAEVTAFGAVGGQILEFGPDLARLVHHKRNRAVPVTAPVAPAAPTAAPGTSSDTPAAPAAAPAPPPSQ